PVIARVAAICVRTPMTRIIQAWKLGRLVVMARGYRLLCAVSIASQIAASPVCRYSCSGSSPYSPIDRGSRLKIDSVWVRVPLGGPLKQALTCGDASARRLLQTGVLQTRNSPVRYDCALPPVAMPSRAKILVCHTRVV